MSSESTPSTFLDPAVLIESSRTEGVRIPTWPLLIACVVGLLVLSSNSQDPLVRGIQISMLPLFAIGAIGFTIYRARLGRRAAAESDAVAALDELLQLRRWQEAADLAHRLLSQPMLLPDRRIFALMHLASLLTRYHRFADARSVHETLLNPGSGELGLDPTLTHSVKVARAMTMLREDHLVDADRAMSELRREVNQARDDIRREQGADKAAQVQSAGVVLLDLYRDVKTRHAEEAIALFEKAMPVLRDQLGVRVADAWVLVAAAYLAMGRHQEASDAYTNATALVPAVELHRRYPETKQLAEQFTATTWPTA